MGFKNDPSRSQGERYPKRCGWACWLAAVLLGTFATSSSAAAVPPSGEVDFEGKVFPILQKHFPSLSAQVLKDSLSYLTFSDKGQQTEQRWENADKLVVDGGGTASGLDFSEGHVWTNQYVDTSKLN